MKKYIVYLCVLFALIIAAPKAVLAAETGSATLSVQKNDVGISLEFPESKAGKVTSLRMQLRVTATSGTMDKPSFKFDDTINSYVKDARVSKEQGAGYIVDIIISGKSSQSIFGKAAGGKIGTLTVKPTGDNNQITVEVMSQDKDSNTPGIKYVEANGLKELVMTLSNTNPVTVTSSGGTSEPSKTSEPSNTPKPSKTSNPSKTPKPTASDKTNTDTKQPEATEAPNKDTQNILSVSCKSGSKSVYFNWQKVDDADGYVLYEYNNKSKEYKSIKTIKDGNKTSYSKKFKYASAHSFSIRSYKMAADGSITYGDYSPIVDIKVPPAKVTGLSYAKGGSKVTLSWKKVSNAKGYKIYRSNKKKGRFSLVKTISKGKKVKYVDRHVSSGGTYYYKIRAYVKDTQGKQHYGEYSKVLKAFVTGK